MISNDNAGRRRDYVFREQWTYAQHRDGNCPDLFGFSGAGALAAVGSIVWLDVMKALTLPASSSDTILCLSKTCGEEGGPDKALCDVLPQIGASPARLQILA